VKAQNVRSTSEIEVERLAAQRRLDSARPQSERNRRGQFATPASLADEILRFAQATMRDESVRFLDPAIGTGAFYSALRRIWTNSRIVRATGFEIDPYYADPCSVLWHATALNLRLEDFTAAANPKREDARYNLVICNPPYVRHHHLTIQKKRRLQRSGASAAGIQLSGLAGLYAYFLLHAQPWMTRGALAGWLIPSEFMDVNYGLQIKRYLLQRVTLLRIHRFDPNEVQFDDALVSSAIVWFQNAMPPIDHSVELSFAGSLTRPQSSCRMSTTELTRARKWTAFKAGETRPTRSPAGTVLGDLFRIQRGIATGANRFFVMSCDQAQERGIPKSFLRPVLPRPRYLELDEVTSCELVVLDCRLPETQVRKRYPRFWRYLESGRTKVAQGFLCRHRTPWYSQEARESTSFVCSYVARHRSDGRLHRFIFNQTAAIATNNYLMLFPRDALARYIAGDLVRARTVWQHLCKIEPAAFSGAGRVYGGGMCKVEPKELASIEAPGIAALLHQRE
jgi:hypothetical protein